MRQLLKRVNLAVGQGWNALWRDAGTVLRRSVIAFALIGLCLTAIGILGDMQGTWASMPFLLNLFSAATTGCFAVPIALIVLRYIASQQALISEKQRLNDLTCTTAHIIYENAIADEIDKAESADMIFRSLNAQAGSICDSFDTESAKPGYAAMFEKTLASWEKAKSLWDASHHRSWESRWQLIIVAWRYLDEALRLRVMGEGLRWLNPETEGRIREQIRIGNQLDADEYHLHDRGFDGPVPPDETYSWVDQEDWQYFKNWSNHMHEVYETSRALADLAREMLLEFGCEVPEKEMTYEEEMTVLDEFDSFKNTERWG